MKRSFLALSLAAALLLGVLAGCGPAATEESPTPETAAPTSEPPAETAVPVPTVRFGVLNGPTGVGAAGLTALWESAATYNNYEIEVYTDNSQVAAGLTSGSIDIAAMASNTAATLYNNSDGAVRMVAVSGLGVLYILENGDTVQSLADLEGRTLYATGQGANPEYVLNYLLTENGVDPADVDIQWMTAQEVTAQMASSEDGICMLPVPAATALMIQDSGVRQALSLTDEWSSVSDGELAMGCIVARTDYIEENPQGVEAFLAAYQDSIEYMSNPDNLDAAAGLVAQYGITANANIAKAAIPQCNLVCLTGDEMKSVLEAYYQVLFDADPTSIGGALPYNSFYYGAE